MFIHYIEEENRFYNNNGKILYNIFDFITPNELLLFKKKRENIVLVKHKQNVLIRWGWW